MIFKFICRIRGHKWLLDERSVSEYVPVPDRCLRCGEKTVYLPWGWCLGGHSLSDHYDDTGKLVVLADCSGPR